MVDRCIQTCSTSTWLSTLTRKVILCVHNRQSQLLNKSLFLSMQQKVGGNAEVVRIQVLESLGSGGFGSVYKCIKRQKGDLTATLREPRIQAFHMDFSRKCFFLSVSAPAAPEIQACHKDFLRKCFFFNVSAPAAFEKQAFHKGFFFNISAPAAFQIQAFHTDFLRRCFLQRCGA